MGIEAKGNRLESVVLRDTLARHPGTTVDRVSPRCLRVTAEGHVLLQILDWEGSSELVQVHVPLDTVRAGLQGVRDSAAPVAICLGEHGYLTLGDLLGTAEIDNGEVAIPRSVIGPLKAKAGDRLPGLEEFIDRNVAGCVFTITSSDVGLGLRDFINKYILTPLVGKRGQPTKSTIIKPLFLKLQKPEGLTGVLMGDLNLRPRETGSFAAVTATVKFFERSGFGAAKETWVHDHLKARIADLKLAKKLDVVLTGLGAGETGIVGSAEGEKPADLAIVAPDQRPLLYVEVTGDGQYWLGSTPSWLIAEMGKPSFGGKLTYQSGIKGPKPDRHLVRIDFGSTSEALIRGAFLQDNIPKFRAQKLLRAPVVWVYVLDCSKSPLNRIDKEDIRYPHPDRVQAL